MDKIKITVIGAGVVGLAIAAELSRRHNGVVVLERHGSYGQETSSRNSEVVHSGIYYPQGSLKARLCVKGAALLYKYCETMSVPHSRLGKLIVATSGLEETSLLKLYNNGLENGLEGITMIGQNEISGVEPNLNAVSAIYSPNTGIVDSHSLMASLYRLAVSRGVIFSFGSEVSSIEKQAGGFAVRIKNEDYSFISEWAINSSGLSSDSVAALAGIDIDSAGYRLRYCKGSYFSYGKGSPVRGLVYPLPHEGLIGLGVHATLDLGGRLRFGPDTEYVDSVDYTVDASKRDSFYEGARKFINGLDKDAFFPDMAGIRPKLARDDFRDFIINNEAEKGLDGLINLVGIESPGLTASLAIAEYVGSIVDRL